MNIKHVFEDSRIVMLEKDIARINEYCQYSDKEKFVMKHLLEKRCNVLWQLNVYDDETKQLLIGFNDALRKACTQLYHRTMTVCQEYQNRKDISGDFEVEGKIFLGYEYPALHPIQTETAKQVWDALTCGVSMHSMMRVAHGRSDSVVSVLLSKVSMRNWRIGWGWRLRTTIGMMDWIENGRKTCILYSPFIIYTIIATSHYTTSYMSVSSTWKYMWSLRIK